MRRVVISGTGIYSSIGKNNLEVLDSLYNECSGIGLSLERKQMGYRSGLTGMLDLPDVKEFVDRRKRNSLPEQGHYACVAAREAFDNAKIDHDYIKNNEIGVIFGADASAAPIIEGVDTIREKKKKKKINIENFLKQIKSNLKDKHKKKQ